MKPVAALLVTLATLTLGAQCALAQTARSQVERLYVIDCGTSVGPDKSRWTPGIDVGKRSTWWATAIWGAPIMNEDRT